MKLTSIVLSFAALAIVTGVAPAVKAESFTPICHRHYVVGLFPNSSQDFFEEGRCLLEIEIQRLLDRQEVSDESILHIDDSVRQQQELIRQQGISPEDIQVAPEDNQP